MTIAIAATGPHAGKAILKALSTAELICTGAIGGFISAASIADGKMTRLQCQQGGTIDLIDNNDCDAFEQGSTAGLISSGPNRPEPLSEFIVAAADSGLVTGHRLPNSIGADGKPMNQSVLDAMAQGEPAELAVKKIINLNPHADCGLIAIDSNQLGYSANTTGVNRPDLGGSHGEREKARVWVLHNAVQPAAPLGALLIAIALDEMRPSIIQTGKISIEEKCVIEFNQPAIAINVDTDHRAVSISVTQQSANVKEATAVNLGFRPPVYQNGQHLGCLMYEPFLLVIGDLLLSADGQPKMSISIGREPQTD